MVEILRYRAIHQADQCAYLFLLDGENQQQCLTYGELDRQARAVAAKLQSTMARGDRALLLYPPGVDFIASFFGCLYAEVVAVPAYPPRDNHNLSRLLAIAADAQASAALSTAAVLEAIERQFGEKSETGGLNLLATDRLSGEADWQQRTPDRSTLAFLQYTSGSTGLPKGVMVTHGNLLHNEQMIKESFGHSESTVFAGWLPLFHDMGLIGNLLQPMYLGIPSVLMAPVAFLQKPLRWLTAISEHRATTSGAPNFAYELCVARISEEQKQGLDLSCWEVAFNGAEPVRAETLERFSEAFACCGFRREAFYPCYGMAETTLQVTGGTKYEPPLFLEVKGEALEENRVEVAGAGEGRRLVGCGRSWLGQQVEIVEPQKLTRLEEGEVGEIWVSGPSVARGYWGRPEETARSFGFHLPDGAGPFLRTGDLGFQRDGHLFVTGRCKDLIIIRGRNHYPQDIELTVERSHPALRAGGGAAFSLEVEGEERLVVVQEVERRAIRKLDVNEVVGAIRQAVSIHHDLKLHAVALVKTASIPKTSSGKVQRRTCRIAFTGEELELVGMWRQFQEVAASASETKSVDSDGDAGESRGVQVIRERLTASIARMASLDPGEISSGEPFSGYGLDSLAAVTLSGELEAWLGRRLSPTLVYDYPSIDALSRHLAGLEEKQSEKPGYPLLAESEGIAVIGIGCRFPGAGGPEEFWELLRDAVDAVGEVPAGRWDADAYYDAEPATPGKMVTRSGGFLPQVDGFDADFFGIAPREAVSMDPQQRLLLEVSWEALEDAGVSRGRASGSSTGVFVGISNNDYASLVSGSVEGGSAYAGTGNAMSIAANRLSYAMDLRGPSLAIDTACSSSLVAVHQACASLRASECTLALAGGVNLMLTPELGIIFSQARMLSPKGRCHSFDAAADGYARGEGCGMVVLKRVSEAKRDGDRIWAVIKGSATGQDGKSNGITAPNGPAQQQVMRRALEQAALSPSQVGYLEAHGTGTPLGDPIEFDSIREVFARDPKADNPCRIGTVKTNIGHLEAAAGIAGLIKAILCLKHGAIAPNLHQKKLSPYICLAGTSLEIPRQLTPWHPGEGKRIAGVSAFGFGGTNCHLVVEEPDTASQAAAENEPPARLVIVSGRSAAALTEQGGLYAGFLGRHPELSAAEFCRGANLRTSLEHRAYAVAANRDELQAKLGALAIDGTKSLVITGGASNPGVVFLYSGQGSQYRGMGRELYRHSELFRSTIDGCEGLLSPYFQVPLTRVLYGSAEETALLDETAYTQPAIFALEYALTLLWKSWGVEPVAVIGHSLGEYVAACVAGVFPLAEGLTLVAKRALLMQALPKDGDMIAVQASEPQVLDAIARAGGDVSLAGVNGAQSCVISGRRKEVARVAELLENRGCRSLKLNVSHAFHSSLMDPVLAPLRECLDRMRLLAPDRPLISNLTGRPCTDEMVSPDYWVNHLRQPVRFAAGMEALLEAGHRLFVEVGPKPALLSTSAGLITAAGGHSFPSLRGQESEWRCMLETLGALHLQGVDIDPQGFERGTSRRTVALPTYPFQRLRYWCQADANRKTGPRRHPLLGTPLSLALSSSTTVWSQRLDERQSAYLQDHRIDGATVFPGAGFVEMMLSAASGTLGEMALECTGIEIDRPLVLYPGREVELQTHLGQEAGGALQLTIYSRQKNPETWSAWTCNASGRAYPLRERAQSVCGLDDLRSRLSRESSGCEFYQAWSGRGNQWGESFQGVERLWAGEGEILARIDIPKPLSGTIADYYVHPGLFDSFGQILAALVPDADSGAFVGQGFDRLRVFGPLRQGPFYSHALLREGESGSRTLQGDVRIYDAFGTLLGEIIGLGFKFLNRQAPAVSGPSDWVHQVVWEELVTPEGAAKDPGSWGIIGGSGFCRDQLPAALAARGAQVVRAVDPASLEELLCRNDLRGLLVVEDAEFSLDDAPVGAATHTAVCQGAALSGILARMAARGPEGTPVWTVTKGVWTLKGEGGQVPPSAALWGMARTAVLELGAVWGGAVDLDPQADPAANAELLAQALLLLSGEDQLAIRSGCFHAPRLRSFPLAAAGEEVSFHEEGAYLVTGGLGDLGLLFARWMVERGAKKLILLGRALLPDRASWDGLYPEGRDAKRVAWVAALEGMGAEVVTVSLDISDEKGCRAWLDGYRRAGNSPVRGIVHAAGVARSGSLVELEEQGLALHLAPKMGGVLVIERLFPAAELDFLVLFSSISALLSSPGLAAYAAGNAFLDAFAARQRTRGGRVLSIAWGGWSELGLAAGFAVPGSAAGAIAPQQGLELAGRLWNLSEPCLCVIPAHWAKWRASYPSAAGVPLFSGFFAAGEDREEPSLEGPDLAEIRSLSEKERLSHWEARLTRYLAWVLNKDSSSVERTQPLNTLGLDSLMALELSTRVERECAVSLPVVELIGGANIAELALRLDELSRSDEAPSGAPTPQHLNHIGPFALSRGQKAQRFLYNLAPESSAYHVAFTLTICSPLDTELVEQSFRAIVARHPALRSSYTGAQQSVHKEPHFEFRVTDASALDGDALLKEAQRAYRRPFDLDEGPVLRVQLFARPKSEHLLLIVVHHIACDGWSLWMLLHEFQKLYQAKGSATLAHLEAPAFSSADYVQWQRELLESPLGQKQRDYWMTRLGGPLPVLDLPTDHPRPPVQGFAGSTVGFRLSPALTAQLKETAQREGATLYMILLAAYQVLLHRYTGQTDILVGSPASGRGQAAFSGVIGYFVNPVVVRGDLSGDPTFSAFLAQLRQSTLEALDHQEYPFPALVEDLKPERDPSRTPVFQVSFGLQKPQGDDVLADLLTGGESADPLSWGALQVKPFEMPQQEGQFDLSLEMAESRLALCGSLKYSTELFQRETAQRMAGHLQQLLEAIACEPGVRLSRLALLTPAELRRLTVEWNLTERDFPRDVCVQQLFELQVEKAPQAPALVCGDQSLSYRELNKRANRLAHRLKAEGVGAETLVGICAERSVEMVVAILGVLKAGGAYLPLDPAYPQDRLAFMLKDSAAQVVLVQSHLLSLLPEGGAKFISLEPGGSDAATPPEENNPRPSAGPENLAYLIYTSGSTGLPKGALLEHRGLCNLVEAQVEAFGITSKSRVLQFASFSFDASVSEIFTAFRAGAVLCLAKADQLRSWQELAKVLREQRITTVTLPPSLLATMPADGFPELATIVAAGEPCSAEIVDKWGPGRVFINAYGPTEATVCATLTRCEPGTGRRPTIGKPIPNARLYVLDSFLQPVPIGVPGELFIGGAGVARGYLNRPELSGEKFVTCRIGAGLEQRLYRSGDLVRYLSDGDLDYLGRLDHQVKMRGFRIELGEIEAALTRHPAIEEAVVLAREDVPGDRRLVAYLCSQTEGLQVDELRGYAKQILPDYMVPSAFVVLSGFPVTPNGKVDRKALPAPGGERQLGSQYAPPKSELEKAIAAVWQEVLQVRSAGVNDNFFDLGGNSLLLAQVFERIQDLSPGGVTMVDLFKFPTIQALARHFAVAAGEESEEAGAEQGGARKAGRDRLKRQKTVREGN